ncbi:hypothetical protein GGI35DRAFT_463855 [Trichoderma velutinum]
MVAIQLSLRPGKHDDLPMDDVKNAQTYTTVIHKDLDGAALLQELTIHVSDLLAISRRFGEKFAQYMDSEQFMDAIFPDRTLLQLTCLKNFDLFTTSQTLSRGKWTDFEPLLYWIWRLILREELRAFERPTTLELNSSPNQVDSDNSPLPPIDIEFGHEDRKWFIKLIIRHGGEMNRTQSFQQNVPEIPRPEREKWGKPSPDQERADGMGVFSIPKGIDQVFKFLFPRDNNIWLSAMTSLDGMANQNVIFDRLVLGFVNPRDRIYVSAEHLHNCSHLFLCFPSKAQQALGKTYYDSIAVAHARKIEQKGATFCATTMEEVPDNE